MVDKSNKSHFFQKQPEKEEVTSPEDLKLKKLEKVLIRLQNAVDNRDNNYERSNTHETSKRNQSNKSKIINPTTTKIKEDRSDREFLSNFMNDEHTNIIPKNMHLLIDNDTNQSISSKEKYKNLSNLMIDDKNITEFNFIRNSDEKVKLNLYMAFSKKSRDVFMNENNPKQSKNQTLFHKINDIHIPKFGYKSTIDQNTEIKNDLINSFNEFSESNIEKTLVSDNNIINNEENNYKKDEIKFNECYFRQEKKGYFRIPTLIKIETKSQSPRKKDFKKQNTYVGPNIMFNPFIKKSDKKIQDDIFWDPEIDADTLSYINHNFISIEDIYNGKNLDDKNCKNDINQNEEEPNLTPIKAKEIFFDKDGNKSFNIPLSNNEGKQEGDYDKLKNDNKFIEFIAITPGVIRSEYQVKSNIEEEMKFNEKLKKDFDNKLNKMIEIDPNLFPRNAELSSKKIERILRFKKLIKQWKEIELTLGPKTNTTEESENTLKELNENDEIQIGKINNFKDGINFKDKSFSEIDEKKSSIYEDEEFDGTSKNFNSINSESQNTPKKSVFNFENSKLDENNSPFSSEKSKSISNIK